MAGFFQKLFGGGETEGPRSLSHPAELQQGDFVKFQHLPQPDVSAKIFEVFKVNTYTYDGVDYPEKILKDRDGNIIFMMIEEEDGEEYVGLSKKIPKSMIGDLIPQNTLDSILERGTGITLRITNKPEGFEAWLANSYRETDEYGGSFAKGDARKDQFGQDERFKAYELYDPSEEYALEIEVYGQGETELCATVYHDINAIEEILPGKSRG